MAWMDRRKLNAVGLEELLNCLPRLQSIQGPVDLLSLPAFVRTNKQHLIHEFDFATLSVLELDESNQKAVDELFEIATTFARSQPKLTKVTLVTEVEGFGSHQLLAVERRYFIVVEALVRGVADFLKEVEIRYRDLVQLISPSYPMSHVQRHSPPLFPAVTNLSLSFNSGIITTDLNLTGLKNLNLEAHFPLLHSVELEFVDGGSDFVPYERRTEEYCCKSVRRLVVRNTYEVRSGRDETTWFAPFIRLFPMVRVLVMEGCGDLERIDVPLWGHRGELWEELRVLRLEGIKEDMRGINWNPLFTGLSRKECDRLERQREPPDVQFFESLRLKSREGREGSFLDFHKLEKLQLGMNHGVAHLTSCCSGAFGSKLIAGCVSLMGLRIEIKRRLCRKHLKCYLAVNYPQPFVHVIDNFTD